MVRTPENLAFSQRLKLALSRSNQKIEGPAQLAIAFNLSYSGNAITNQAAQKWLVGDNKPSAEKIEVLAGMLNVSALWLRLGIADSKPLQIESPTLRYGRETPSLAEQQLLAHFRLLSAHQRQLVAGITEQFALDREMWVSQNPGSDQG